MSYQFVRKFALPAPQDLTTQTFYIVSAPGSHRADLYYVDNSGNVRAFLNETRVEEMLAGIQAQMLFHVVETMQERDDLVLTADSLVIVTGDVNSIPTPTPQMFLYIQSLTTFISLNGTHTHSNLSVLNELQEDGDGRLTYRGQRVSNVSIELAEW